MSFSAPSSASGIARAAAEIENVARLGDFLAQLLDLGFLFQELGDVARRFQQRGAEPLFIGLARDGRAPRPPRWRSDASAASWQVKALVEATPISGPARSAARCRPRARCELSATLTTAMVVWPCALASRSAASVSAVSPDCETNSATPSFGIDRIAIAQFRRDIDFHRQPRQLLEPVFADHAGVIGGAAGRDGQPRAPSPAPRAGPRPGGAPSGPAGSR